jgi:hypothetical protein
LYKKRELLVLDTGKLHTRFWWGDLREIDHFEHLGIDGRIIFKLILKTWDGEIWTELIWRRIGTGGGHF